MNLIISFLNIYFLINISKKIGKKIDSRNYSFVFLHHNKDYVQTPFLAKFLNTKTIYFCAEPQRQFYDKGLLKSFKSNKQSGKTIYTFLTDLLDIPCKNYLSKKIELLDYENIQHCDVVLTNSYYSYESILSAYGIVSKVVYLGGDVFPKKSANKISKKNQTKKQIISVGAINALKGFEFIINSIALVDENIRPNFMIVGNSIDKVYSKKIEEVAIDKNVKLNIKVNVSDDDLYQYLNQSYLFAYAPFLEPLGLAPLEAMSMGLPVIAVKEGGLRETIANGKNGFLVDRDNDLFADAISKLISDKDKHNLIKKHNVKSIQDFWNWEMAYQRFLEAIN